MTTLTTTQGTFTLKDTHDVKQLTNRITMAIYATNRLSEPETLALATAVTYNTDSLKDIHDALPHIEVDGGMALELSEDGIYDVLEYAGLYKDGHKSDRLVSMMLRTERSYPTPANMVIGDAIRGVVRRRNYGAKGGLVQSAIHILEKTEFCVDEFMLEVAKRVHKRFTRDEQYVIDGSQELVNRNNLAVHSEFFADDRARLYQADFHGPNGQSSDLARSLMDLHGVSKDYNVKAAIKVIRDEMADMVSDVDGTLEALKAIKSASKFIEAALQAPEAGISKPWSFVKAAKILIALQKGKKPYIGMAFGLDAKCSGPQLGALLTGDGDIAASCGFSTVKVKDAYERAIDMCESMGVHGFERASIKKVYMEVFYGLSWFTFTKLDDKGAHVYKSTHDYAPEVLRIISTINVPDDVEDKEEAQAQLLHKAIEESFGKMRGLRNTIKEAHIEGYDDDGIPIFRTEVATKYRTPDGFEVAMKYFVRVDIDGEKTSHDMEPADVAVAYSTGAGIITEVYEKMTFKTDEVALMDFARTGFVNFIQGEDAFLARLIVKKLDNLKVKHIIAVHDCFRVSIIDMINGKLVKAIKRAYGEFLTSGDAISRYFDGVKEAGSDLPVNMQSVEDGMPIIEGEINYKGLVDSLGKEAYFFAK